MFISILEINMQKKWVKLVIYKDYYPGILSFICYYTAICLKLMVLHIRIFMDKVFAIEIFTLFYAASSSHVTV